MPDTDIRASRELCESARDACYLAAKDAAWLWSIFVRVLWAMSLKAIDASGQVQCLRWIVTAQGWGADFTCFDDRRS
ncbi:MAG: hypothetical protein U5N55_13535 [Cypionkella sp.]|nr:hypothetical protein [Cypionkella sp.]